MCFETKPKTKYHLRSSSLKMARLIFLVTCLVVIMFELHLVSSTNNTYNIQYHVVLDHVHHLTEHSHEGQDNQLLHPLFKWPESVNLTSKAAKSCKFGNRVSGTK